jgi:hypothetical protein
MAQLGRNWNKYAPAVDQTPPHMAPWWWIQSLKKIFCSFPNIVKENISI